MTTEIETSNDCMVGVAGGGLVMFMPPQRMEIIDKEKALRLAAWLVVLSCDDERFDAIREAVMNT